MELNENLSDLMAGEYGINLSQKALDDIREAIESDAVNEVANLARQLNESNERNGVLRIAVSQAVETFKKYDMDFAEYPVPKRHKDFMSMMDSSLNPKQNKQG